MITFHRDLIVSLLWIGLEWEVVHVRHVLVLQGFRYLMDGVLLLSQWIQPKRQTSLSIV